MGSLMRRARYPASRADVRIIIGQHNGGYFHGQHQWNNGRISSGQNNGEDFRTSPGLINSTK